MTVRVHLVEAPDEQRLDVYLAEREPELSRSQLKRLVGEGNVLLNGGLPKAGSRVRTGDLVSVTVPAPRPTEVVPEDIPLQVVYQDGEMLVVDKPAGLTVHPAPGHPSGTLVNALLALCPDLKGIGGELRPGIVHRLDKDTSGLMMVAKSGPAHSSLSRQIKDRAVKKGYTAMVMGRVALDEGRIDSPIGRDPRNRKRMAAAPGGRDAVTRYRVVTRYERHTLLEVFPETGRTHQIRVHLAHAGHPILGDPVYGGRSGLLPRQFLHAHLLGMRHPSSGEYMEFRSDLPEDLERTVEAVAG